MNRNIDLLKAVELFHKGLSGYVVDGLLKKWGDELLSLPPNAPQHFKLRPPVRTEYLACFLFFLALFSLKNTVITCDLQSLA